MIFEPMNQDVECPKALLHSLFLIVCFMYYHLVLEHTPTEVGEGDKNLGGEKKQILKQLGKTIFILPEGCQVLL